MKIRVLKFGGTSVATAEARRQAAQRVVSAREQGYAPVVVVSAIGRRGDPYATDTLIGLLREIDPDVAPDPREMDLMIACGEILSSVIFAHLLKTMGHAAQAFRGGQAGIRTDGAYGNARIVEVKPQSLVKALSEGLIPIVCGFQGVYIGPDPEPGKERAPGAELTTLGRGGSDTTAAALGAALGAESVVIYTDVDGIKTADPRAVPDAVTLRQVSYEEVAELAHLGASVLHPRAAEIAMKFGMTLWVKNTFSDDPGTEVVPAERFAGRKTTGVAAMGKLTYLSMNLGEVDGASRAILRSHVLSLLARHGMSLYVTQISAHGFGFAVRRDQFARAEALLDGLVVPLGSGSLALVHVGRHPSDRAATQAGLLDQAILVPVDLTESCTLVSVIGRETMRHPGIMRAALAALEEAQVPVYQTSDSESSLSALVPEADADRAMRALHSRFALTEAQ